MAARSIRWVEEDEEEDVWRRRGEPMRLERREGWRSTGGVLISGVGEGDAGSTGGMVK